MLQHLENLNELSVKFYGAHTLSTRDAPAYDLLSCSGWLQLIDIHQADKFNLITINKVHFMLRPQDISYTTCGINTCTWLCCSVAKP